PCAGHLGFNKPGIGRQAVGVVVHQDGDLEALDRLDHRCCTSCNAYFSAISMPSGASGPTGMKSKSISPVGPSGRPSTSVLAASTDSAFTRNTTPGASSLNHICSMTPSR